MIRPNQFDGLS